MRVNKRAEGNIRVGDIRRGKERHFIKSLLLQEGSITPAEFLWDKPEDLEQVIGGKFKTVLIHSPRLTAYCPKLFTYVLDVDEDSRRPINPLASWVCSRLQTGVFSAEGVRGSVVICGAIEKHTLPASLRATIDAEIRKLCFDFKNIVEHR